MTFPFHLPLRCLRRAISAVALVLAVGLHAQETARLLLLYTTDLHDHVRPGPGGLGGLPYVSGYVQSVRAARSDVLLLDAGDVTEKGDLVAFRTHGIMTYEAMQRIGYDGVAVGNHDFDDLPEERLRAFERALGQELLCLNVTRPDGSRLFAGSRLVERGGVRVGLIGLLTPRKPAQGGLDFAESGRALAAEARKLRSAGAQLVVAICHERATRCAEWSREAPEVNVFVAGHSHQALPEPLVVPETGALIVQAGSYARWVGWLELEVDAAAGGVRRHTGRLVALRHDEVPVDAAMRAWVEERERELAPEAGELVFDNPAEIDGFTVARVAAEALRVASGADVAFCHPYQVIRNVLPAGRIDVNAVFKTGGDRGRESVEVELTGEQIAAYADALERVQREPPEWAGFRRWREGGPDGERTRTDLDPARRYRTLMAKLEWETRFLRLAEQVAGRDPTHPLVAAARLQPRPSPVTFTDAVVAYLRAVVRAGESPASRAEDLVRRRGAVP